MISDQLWNEIQIMLTSGMSVNTGDEQQRRRQEEEADQARVAGPIACPPSRWPVVGRDDPMDRVAARWCRLGSAERQAQEMSFICCFASAMTVSRSSSV